MAFEMMENGESGALIKVIGVGGAGGNVINNMIRKQVKGNVVFIAANTDRQALSQSEAEVQIQLGHTGLGAGSKPEVGQQAANEAREEIGRRFARRKHGFYYSRNGWRYRNRCSFNCGRSGSRIGHSYRCRCYQAVLF